MRKGHLHKYSRRRMISKFTNSLDKAHNYLRIRVVRVELGQSRNEHRKDKLALVQESVSRGTMVKMSVHSDCSSKDGAGSQSV